MTTAAKLPDDITPDNHSEKSFSMRSKIITLIILVVLVCAIFFSLIGAFRMRKESKTSARKIMNLTCVQETTELNAQLKQIEYSLDAIVSYVEANVPDPDAVDENFSLFEEHQKQVQDYFEALVASNPAVYCYYYRYRLETYPTSGFWRISKNQDGVFENAEVTDFSQFDPDDMEHVGWYYIPAQQGGSLWMEPYWNANDGVYTLSYVCSLEDEEGNTYGVVGIDMDFAKIIEAVNQIHAYDTGYAALLSGDGVIYAHPDMTDSQDPIELGEEYDEIIEQMQEESSGDTLISYTYKGIKKYIAYCSLENGMRFLLSVPQAEIDASGRKMLVEYAGLSVAVLALFLLLGVWLARQLTRPLAELKETAERIEQGEKDVVFPKVTHDEIGVLNTAMQKMVHSQNKLVTDLSDMSFHDALTGLLNRHALDVKLNPSAERTYYVAMSDVNKFKMFNDTYGHQVGDQVLAKAGQALLSHFRKTDCYRYGGDEFLIISMDIGKEVFEQRIFAWKRDVSQIEIPEVEQSITVSCGMVSGHASSKEELFDLIRQADDELYKIKRGKTDAMVEDEEIIGDVYEAITAGQIVPFYQPKVDTRDNRIIGAEALVRWLRNDGIVPPGSFLPILETTGDICHLDRAVFEQVCKQIQSWIKEGISVPTISCNFSMWHLKDEHFADMLIDIADRYEVPHEKLEIEFTETVNVSEQQKLLRTVQTLRKAGFRTALDDFGTGYSSLAIIKNIPIDEVKLDRSLISSWNEVATMDDSGMVLVKNIVSLVKDMQMMCLAEGVETNRQKELLQSFNCNYVQGFLYDRPIPMADFEERLKTGFYEEREDIPQKQQEASEMDNVRFEEHVLLAEDNDINREITVNVLENLGVVVDTAVNGRDALEQFKASEENTYDLILMDIQMPEMDGYESSRAIRALDRKDAKTVPIIAVTVDAYRETRQQAEEAGMSGYVTKPLDPNRLIQVMEELRSKKEGADSDGNGKTV